VATITWRLDFTPQILPSKAPWSRFDEV
jgi:hypothetical protein